MFLFEGTATGPFDVRSSYSDIVYTVTPEDGLFSVLLPYTATPSFGAPVLGNYTVIYNDALTTVTRYPDYFDTLTSMDYLFSGCRELTSVPDLGFTSRVKSFKGTFRGCSKLETAPWIDMSNATTVSELFYNCFKLTSVPDYDTRKVTDFSYMFTSCKVLAEFPDLDTSKGTSFRCTFCDCDAMVTIPSYDYSKGTTFYGFAQGCATLKNIPDMNTSSATTMEAMFAQCPVLETCPYLDTHNVTTMASMFYNDNNLKTIPLFDTSNVRSLHGFAWRCYKLESIPNFNTSNCTLFSVAFTACETLTELPPLDFSKATSISQMCSGCKNMTKMPSEVHFERVKAAYAAFAGTKLTDVPTMYMPVCTEAKDMFTHVPAAEGHWGLITLPKCTSFYGTFNSCLFETSPLRSTGSGQNFRELFYASRVVTIPELDLSKATNVSDTFTNAFYLEEIESISGISISVNFSSCSLSKATLLRILDALQAVSGKTLILGATNLAKLTDEEKAIATGKGWTLQ